MPLAKTSIKVAGLDTEFGRERLSSIMELSKLGLRMFGHSREVLAGTVRNLAEAEWLTQVGPTTGTTDASGDLVITFQNAFPRALIHIDVTTSVAGVRANPHTISLTGFTARRSDGAAASTQFIWKALGY